MIGSPTFGAARGTASPKAAIDAITSAARDFLAAVYRSTGHEPKALLMAIGDDLFARAALLHAERTGRDAAELERAGVLDLELDGIELRIVSESAAARASARAG